MNILARALNAGLISCALLVASGCAVYPAHYHDERSYGPPPHAPAHGYRAKYQNHELVYDSRLGAYIVVGLPDYYFYDGHYYRHDHDSWYYSRYIDRDWHGYNERKLPPGLAKKYHDDDNGRGRGKGHYDDYDDHGNGRR